MAAPEKAVVAAVEAARAAAAAVAVAGVAAVEGVVETAFETRLDRDVVARLAPASRLPARLNPARHPGGMPDTQHPYLDRRRAESFGSVAENYDRFRPRYPCGLITGLVVREGLRVLDVGAGTGIASAQLTAAGAEVLAVEPDPRMVEIAAGKGISVEQAQFEDWDPRGRRFDLVVFAQSFHWMRPRESLRKVAALLSPDARLALLSNRITPTAPPRQSLDDIYAGFDMPHGPPIDATRTTELHTLLDECGYTTEEREEVEELHYTTDDWLGMVFTYSNHLSLEPESRTLLRSQLGAHLGTAGLTARNDALAIICALRR